MTYYYMCKHNYYISKMVISRNTHNIKLHHVKNNDQKKIRVYGQTSAPNIKYPNDFKTNNSIARLLLSNTLLNKRQ